MQENQSDKMHHFSSPDSQALATGLSVMANNVWLAGTVFQCTGYQ
jgi:hypothetical protein